MDGNVTIEPKSATVAVTNGPSAGMSASCPIASDISAPTTVRPIAPICADGLVPATPATGEPIFERVAPTDLLVESRYQRDLSPKSVKLIRFIVEHWDWRRFKPPVAAMTERGLELIDGQHTATAAATLGFAAIPVMVVEAPELKARSAAFVSHNKDRVAVTPMQLHHALVAADDEDAQTVEQVCARAGVRLVRSAYGGYDWQPGDTVALGAIRGLIDRRGAMRARQVLEVLVKADVRPVSASGIRAVEDLMCTPEHADEIEADSIAAAIQATEGSSENDAKVFAATHCVPLWKGYVAVWFKKCRKKRKAVA